MTTRARKIALLSVAAVVAVIALLSVFAPETSMLAGGGLLCIAILALATLLLPIPRPEKSRPTARILIDGALVATAFWALVYQLILVRLSTSEAVQAHQLGVMSIVMALFGLGLVCVVIGHVAERFRLPVGLIAAGLGIATAASIILSLPNMAPGPLLSLAAVIGGVVSMVGLIFAALRLDVNEPEASLSQVPVESSWRRFSNALPSIMVGVVLAMAILLAFTGRALTTIDYITGLVFLALLIAQQLVANRERERLTSELQARGALFQSLVTGSSELITLHDVQGSVMYASPAVYRLLGLEPGGQKMHTLDTYIHPEDIRKIEAAAKELLKSDKETGECVVRVRCQTDQTEPQWRWMQSVLHNQLSDPNVAGIVANTRDIHEEHELGQRLSYEAYHDALTGLGNLSLARRIFAEQSYGVDRTPTTLILLDLDGFKTLNDTFGHAFGDELLVAVARRLRRNVVDEDAISRIGGDEFVLILESEQEARAIAVAILESLRSPLLVQGTSVIVHASMGLARSIDASSSEELLRNADLAMYEAKALGGNTFVSYDEGMFEQTSRRMQIQEGLRNALANDGFQLAIQPLLDLRTRTVIGGEVLLRWSDENLGPVPPDIFIPVAESSGLIGQIDRWVLNATCQLIRQWRDDGVAVPQLGVNVSRRQITDGLDELISEVIRENDVDAQGLCIEVTESAVVPDPEASVRVLEAVRSLGACVALDDFGTGQSSLSQLAKLPVDRVKIDKSFVMPSSTDQAALDLLASIVGLCHSLRMPVVAEGIEDEKAATNLVAMGAQIGQGYHFYKPMPVDEFRELITVELPQQRAPGGVALTVEDVLSADEFEFVVDEQPSGADARHQE